MTGQFCSQLEGNGSFYKGFTGSYISMVLPPEVKCDLKVPDEPCAGFNERLVYATANRTCLRIPHDLTHAG